MLTSFGIQGTYQFLPIIFLSKNEETKAELVHKPRHDLESFYWVLLWVVLRHTQHPLGKGFYENIFVRGDQLRKWLWVADRDAIPGLEDAKMLVFIDNEPLTSLVEEFRLLVKDQYLRPSEDVLTHDAVLAIFDGELAKDGWPSHCDRIPYTPPSPVNQSLNIHVSPSVRMSYLGGTNPSKRGANHLVEPQSSSGSSTNEQRPPPKRAKWDSSGRGDVPRGTAEDRAEDSSAC